MEVKERTLSREPNRGRAVSPSHRQEVVLSSCAHTAEGIQRRLIPLNGETQPQVSLGWEGVGLPAGGQWAGWGLAEHSWQKQCDRPASSPPVQREQVAQL